MALRIVNIFGVTLVKVDKLDYDITGDKPVEHMDGKNQEGITPLQNALGWIQVAKDAVPALLGLGSGLIKLGEKRIDAQIRIAEKMEKSGVKEKKDGRGKEVDFEVELQGIGDGKGEEV